MSVTTQSKPKTSSKTETPPPAAQKPGVLLYDLTNQAELARRRKLADRRRAYEQGLLATARGRQLSEDELADFHEAAADCEIGRQKMEEHLAKLRSFVTEARAEPVDPEVLAARMKEIKDEEERLKERLRELTRDRVNCGADIQRAAISRTAASGGYCKNDFASIDFAAVAAELRAEREQASK